MAYSSAPSTNLTAGAAHTKGSYVQLVAATPFASSRLHLWPRAGSAGNRFFLLDLATGSTGAEAVILANLAVAVDTDALVAAPVAITVDVPAGTRVAARCQAVTAGTVLGLAVLVEDRPLGSLVTPVTYGADPANTQGTQMDPGGTINTKGSYVQVSASTSARIDALAVCLTPESQGVTLSAFTAWQVDVATGAAAAESVVLPDLSVVANTLTDCPRPAIIRLPVSIPAGTRLAVRCQCSRNTAVERLLRVTLIGMQEPASASSGPTAVAYVG